MDVDPPRHLGVDMNFRAFDEGELPKDILIHLLRRFCFFSDTERLTSATEDYPSALEPQQLLAEIDEAATLQETAAAVRQATMKNIRPGREG